MFGFMSKYGFPEDFPQDGSPFSQPAPPPNCNQAAQSAYQRHVIEMTDYWWVTSVIRHSKWSSPVWITECFTNETFWVHSDRYQSCFPTHILDTNVMLSNNKRRYRCLHFCCTDLYTVPHFVECFDRLTLFRFLLWRSMHLLWLIFCLSLHSGLIMKSSLKILSQIVPASLRPISHT